MFKNKKIGIIGLGYVGLPLAIEFGKKINTVGYDICKDKILSYSKNIDPMNEISKNEFIKAKLLEFSNNPKCIYQCDYLVVSVPTPVNAKNAPDFKFLKKACEIIGKNLRKDTIVIFESTVYPGATEEICIPIIEKYSKLIWKIDFNVAYSPERINPGDKKHNLKNIVKIVSADTLKTLNNTKKLYEQIIDAGVYPVSSIRAAEAAKIIENIQRDTNIALINELAVILKKLNLSTKEVLDAANTKWNFLDFRPGLVGGHCIGVDPYYLIHKSLEMGYTPDVIKAGRKINNYVPKFIAEEITSFLDQSKSTYIKRKVKINILGITFKENCSDTRNSKVIDVINNLKKYNYEIKVSDPIASETEVMNNFKLNLIDINKLKKADILIVAVAHDLYKNIENLELKKLLNKKGIIFDIKSLYNVNNLNKLGYQVWQF
jgi:UDP-N-acetyl-D-galactosamine dehydrogenase